jgi:hypothetical protein
MSVSSRIPCGRNFVKTLGPKYGNACLPLWSRDRLIMSPAPSA